MAVKARAEITLAGVSDGAKGAKGDTGVSVEATYRYYKLASSAPSKPTTTPSSTPSGWTATEPTYTAGSANSLYCVDGTLFSDGTFSWSSVQLSSSYAAAKDAYDMAEEANVAAGDAQDVVNGAVESCSTLSAELQKCNDSITSKFEESKTYTDGKTEVVENWIRQGSEGDTAYLELAGTGSSFGARLDNSELGFYDGGDKLAWFGNKQMHIADADIDGATIDNIKIGEYEIQAKDGHFSIAYVG